MNTISLIIPIRNSPREVRRLLTSLENTNYTIVREVILADDASDATTKAVIEIFAPKIPNCKVLSRRTNLGFIENVNDAFSSANEPIVVLANSDTILPSGWAERIVAPFDKHLEIALACPYTTNATNLVVRPGPGQNWRDVDILISRSEPIYPPCAPIVGFFVGIRKAPFSREPLLDTRYGSGYWEDTDLHFRSLSRGFRNVVVDNLLVYHSSHSPSFSQDNNLPAINSRNRDVFLSRWAAEYSEYQISLNVIGAPNCHLVEPNSDICRFTNRRAYDVIFVLPIAEAAIGGVSVVLELIDELNARGVASAAFIDGPCNRQFVLDRYQTAPFLSVNEIKEAVQSAGTVISTSWDSVTTAKCISSFFSSKLLNLAQGPESAFNSGQFAQRAVADLTNVDGIFSVSPYMDEYVRYTGKELMRIRVGPSSDVFYDKDQKRDARSIAVCLRSNPLKGTGHAVSVALAAARSGFRIHTFGHDGFNWDLKGDGIFHHGALNPSELATLFSRVGFYVDCSHMEGLGLLPLEAAFCGCVPIIRHLNGLSGVLTPDVDFIQLASDFPEEEFFQSLLPRRQRIQARAAELKQARSIEIAAEDLIYSIKTSSGILGGSTVARNTDISKLINDLRDLRVRENLLQDHIEAIRTSTSWRLTGPMRVFGRRLKALRSGRQR